MVTTVLVSLAIILPLLILAFPVTRSRKMRDLRDKVFRGHPVSIFANMAAGFVFLVYGPLPLRESRGPWQFLLALICLAVFAGTAIWSIWGKDRHGSRILLANVGLMFLAAAGVFAWQHWAAQPIELRREPYIHVMPVVFGLLMVFIVLAWWWSGVLVRNYRDRYFAGNEGIYQALLRRAEIFDPVNQTSTRKIDLDLLCAIAVVPFIYPFQVAFFTAMIVLIRAPRPTATWQLVVGFLGIAVLYGLSEIWSATRGIRFFLDRAFFFGGQFLVSVFVMVLAVAYQAEVQEVVILLNGASGLSITFIILAVYCAFWIHETWIHFILNHRLIGLLYPPGMSPESSPYLQVAYPYAGPTAASAVAAGGRAIEISGARFVAVGVTQADTDRLEIKSFEKAGIFEALVRAGAADVNLPDLLRILVARLESRHEDLAKTTNELLKAIESNEPPLADAAPALRQKADALRPALEKFAESLGASDADIQLRRTIKDVLASLEQAEISLRMYRLGAATPGQLRERLGLRKLAGRIGGYFACLNIAMILTVAGLFTAVAKLGGTTPELEIDPAAPAVKANDSFAGLANEIRRRKKEDKIILVAGSGGGTRAALYTTSVLRGLWDQQQIERVRLCSGVSGGSASIAYLAMHYDSLVKEKDETKAGPAWSDYVQAMAKPYIDDVLCGAGETRIVTQQSRIGTLLADSFQWRWSDHKPQAGTRHFLGEAPIGLIFNTTFAGESPWNKDAGKWGPVDASDAGARLILTNAVRADATFLANLKHVIRADSTIPLAKAAALSANFPPVFPNALIEVKEERRYYITDGGASENQGLVALLGALRAALKDLERKDQPGQPLAKIDTPELPTIYIIAANASALSIDFADDRGIQPMQYSCGVYAEELEAFLVKEVTKRYEDLGGKLFVRRLNMPKVCRARGGVTTHWMLAESIMFRKPTAGSDETVTLPGPAVRELIADLHLRKPGGNVELTTEKQKQDMTKLREWMEETEYRKNWEKLVSELTGK